MIAATLHGPYIENWAVRFNSEPMVGDIVNLTGERYRVIRREWVGGQGGYSLHLTVEIV